jgi:hypothetical protein
VPLNAILVSMAEERPSDRVTPACRWRTSAETLDLIEALERIEALLLRLDERLGSMAAPSTPSLDRELLAREVP